MIKSDTNLLHADITDEITSCAYDVYNHVGFGFSEKVYENAKIIKMRQKGLSSIQQAPIDVHFENQLIGSSSQISLWRTRL